MSETELIGAGFVMFITLLILLYLAFDAYLSWRRTRVMNELIDTSQETENPGNSDPNPPQTDPTSPTPTEAYRPNRSDDT